MNRPIPESVGPSLHGIVRFRAEIEPDLPVFRTVEGHALGWAGLHDEGSGWAAELSRAGVGRGDVVATMLATGADPVLAWLGASTLGALDAPLNHAYRGAWLERTMATLDPAAVVLDGRFLDQWAPLLPDIAVPVLVRNPPAGFRPTGTMRLLDTTGGERLQASPRTADDGDPATIILTSGTTGSSKAVVVPWGRCLQTVRLGRALDPAGDGVYYSPFPPFHWSSRAPVYRAAQRGTSLVTRESFKTGEWLDDIRRFGCTGTLLIGAMIKFLMASSERDDDADNPLRACFAGPIPTGIDDFARRFGIERVISTYGMSEIPNVFLTPDEESVTELTRTAAGKTLDVPVRLVDDDGAEVGPNQVGELQVGGERNRLCLGYLHDPDSTARSWTPDGWFRTGDLFRQDEAGYYYFVDRLKDALRRRGENISSTEVEECAMAHPAVVECAVVGIPSEWSEEEVLLVAVLRPGAPVSPAELIAFMTDRVPAFALPRYVRFTDELPKTPTHKIQKALLRARGVDECTWDRVEAVPGTSRPTPTRSSR